MNKRLEMIFKNRADEIDGQNFLYSFFLVPCPLCDSMRFLTNNDEIPCKGKAVIASVLCDPRAV